MLFGLMTDAQFRDVKAELRGKYPYRGLENIEVSVLKCYRIHLENTLAEYGPPRCDRASRGRVGG